jgi:hypothetical protein
MNNVALASAQLIGLRDVWFGILVTPFGLLAHMLFFVALGWLVRKSTGRGYPAEVARIDATRGMSITMYVALLCGLIDGGRGIEQLLRSGIGSVEILIVLMLGLTQEIVGFFRYRPV